MPPDQFNMRQRYESDMHGHYMAERVTIATRTGIKRITLKNLKADDANWRTVNFVRAALESKLCPATQSLLNGKEHFVWLVQNDYNLEHLRTPDFTWRYDGTVLAYLRTCYDFDQTGAGMIVSDHSTVYGDDNCNVVAGIYGRVFLGSYSTATVGNGGNAVTGSHSTAISGQRGYSTVGYRGIAISSYNGTVTGGPDSILQISHVKPQDRERLKIAYVGEDGILPNVPYTLNDAGEFIRA